MRAVARRAVIATVGVCAFASVAPGESDALRGTLEGRVTDVETGHPVVGAQISLIVAREGRLADVNGLFTFGDYDVHGPDTIVVRHLQYDSMRLAIDAYDLGPLDLRLELEKRPIELEGLAVRVDRSEAQRMADQFEGRMWTREEFEPWAQASVSALDPLRAGPGIVAVHESDDGDRCVEVRSRHGCAIIYVNGMRTPSIHLATLPVDIIDSYVILEPLEGQFLYGGDGGGGVILIYTKR